MSRLVDLHDLDPTAFVYVLRVESYVTILYIFCVIVNRLSIVPVFLRRNHLPGGL